MKNHLAFIRFWSFSTLAILIGLSLAESTSAQDDDREADHEALRALRAVAEKAINTNQMELLRPHLDDPFSVVTYTDREFTDFDVFLARWQKTRDDLLGDGNYTTKMLPERSQLIGDIAICRGNSKNVLINGDGEQFEFESHWSATCRKVDGQWKIVRAHSSLSPFDNPMLKSTVKSILIKVSLAALVVGLLVGWIAQSILARRRAKQIAATATT